MSSRKQNGSRFLFSSEPRDFVTHVTLGQRNGERDWRDLTRNTRERHVMCIPFILPTRQILGIRHGRYRHRGRRVAGYIWSEPCVLLIYCCSVRCIFARSFNEQVCVPWFAILSIEGHPNFLQNIFLCCWNDLLPFYRHYSFCWVFWSAAFI